MASAIRVLHIIVLLTILITISDTLVLTGSNVWIDVHYDSNVPYAYDEALSVNETMNGKGYWYGVYYEVFIWRDASRSFIINGSLPFAKIWHFAGHGGLDTYFPYDNYLVTHWGELIYGRDIPNLSNVYGGGPMRLAFLSSCYSGQPQSYIWQYMLAQGFLDQGAVAVMGYRDPVLSYDAYQFAKYFYRYVAGIEGPPRTIAEAINEALDKVPSVRGNIQLYGNGNVYLIFIMR